MRRRTPKPAGRPGAVVRRVLRGALVLAAFASLAALPSCTAPRVRVPQAEPPPARPAPAPVEIDGTRRIEEELEVVSVALDGGAPETLSAALLTSAPAPTALEDPAADRPAPRPGRAISAISSLGRDRTVLYAVDGLVFVRGTTRLDRGSRAKLDQLVERLRLGDAEFVLEVHGSDDPRGLRPRETFLASRRAITLRAALHRQAGIPLDRIAALAHGPAPPDTPAAHDAASEPRARVLVLRPPGAI